MAGWTVVEFELMATADAALREQRAAGPRAAPPCRSSSPRPPASRRGRGAPASPAQVTIPASDPPHRARRLLDAPGAGPRPSPGRPRRRLVLCRRRRRSSPPRASRAAVAAPMPEAAPVTTTARSGSAARLQDVERLVGVRAHGELGVDDVEQGAVGVDDEGDPLVGQEARRCAWPRAAWPRCGRDRRAAGSRGTPSRRTASACRPSRR